MPGVAAGAAAGSVGEPPSKSPSRSVAEGCAGATGAAGEGVGMPAIAAEGIERDGASSSSTGSLLRSFLAKAGMPVGPG